MLLGKAQRGTDPRSRNDRPQECRPVRPGTGAEKWNLHVGRHPDVPGPCVPTPALLPRRTGRTHPALAASRAVTQSNRPAGTGSNSSLPTAPPRSSADRAPVYDTGSAGSTPAEETRSTTAAPGRPMSSGRPRGGRAACGCSSAARAAASKAAPAPVRVRSSVPPATPVAALAPWPRGKAAACRAVYAGSTPAWASSRTVTSVPRGVSVARQPLKLVGLVRIQAGERTRARGETVDAPASGAGGA